MWTPSPLHHSRMAALQQRLGFTEYAQLHAWSIAHPEAFWQLIWDDCSVIGSSTGLPARVGARWFPNAHLNFAENLLRRRDHSTAIVFWGEDRVQHRLTHAELYAETARLAAAFKAIGIVPGDRIAAWTPNIPETLIAMLAASSLGAIWASASPDFGVQGVLDRFQQIEPKVLIAADGYFYNGKQIDTLERLRDIAAAIPSLQRVIVVPYAGPATAISEIPHAQSWSGFTAVDAAEIEFAQLPFHHPLYILFSSGTTGAPKCIVHGAGGTLLQHLKEHQLHCDIRPGDRLFYYTTCGWMMWNWLVSGLASQAEILLYDGSPSVHENRILFEYAEAERITHFGTSAKFIDTLAKAEFKAQPLPHLRTIFSTGSPLSPAGFDYVYSHIKPDVALQSISGGTDIVSCFVLGCPTRPVYRGEIQCRGLGMAVDVYDPEGRPVRGEKGDLVCTQPFPSMPVGFWNDDDDRAYRAAYFDRYPGVWCHGDYAEITAHDGVIIYGRSDAVLNPGGVRIGTAEIYRHVEALPEIVESIAIGQEWEGDVRVVLFVKLREGAALDEELEKRIRTTIRNNTTPRHVPARIVAVPDIPRTKSGKIVELAVREKVHGRPVKNVEALANPEALCYFEVP